jgi:hypothetical protein
MVIKTINKPLNLKEMKTMFAIAGMAFFLSSGFVPAANDIETPGAVPGASAEINLKSFMPVTPKEAPFDEDLPAGTISEDRINLAPFTPLTADFDDDLPGDTTPDELPGKLKPLTPAVVDFDENLPDPYPVLNLKPLTPSKALFEE